MKMLSEGAMEKQQYKFVKYINIFDESAILFALDKDAVEQTIDGAQFVEVTPDFQRAYMVRKDSLKAIGSVTREY
jgi:hypothetical protein